MSRGNTGTDDNILIVGSRVVSERKGKPLSGENKVDRQHSEDQTERVATLDDLSDHRTIHRDEV